MHHYFTNPEYRRLLILRTFGNFLILSSLFMIGKTFSQPFYEEARFYLDQYSHKQYVIADSHSAQPSPAVQKGLLNELLKVQPYEVLIPQDPTFSLVIPKIGANARILNANAADETEYLATLKKAVAHADGTAYPGEGGNVFLFAHSTDYFWNVGTYNAVFYLLYKLDLNDEISVFYNGDRYIYKVFDKKIIDPSDVHYLTDKSDTELLTLQTCWPPGTTLKRLLVFAKRVAE